MRLRNSFLLAAVTTLAMQATADAASRSTVSPALTIARDLGATDPAQIISITVHLKSSRQALLESHVNALYDPGSSVFHQWMTDAELKQFAPSDAQIATVRAQLEKYGLTVVSISKTGFSMRAQGSVSAVQNAFNTQLRQFSLNGKTFRSNISNATLDGEAGEYVAAVSGLESHTVRPTLSRALNMSTGKPYLAVPLNKVLAAGGLSSMISDEILGPSKTFTYTTPNAAFPTATYSGIVYAPFPKLIPDYTPKQLQAAYGLGPAYAKGLNGAGQTVVLVEGFGYPTAKTDANAFASLTGLPALTASNFQIVYPEGQPANPQIGILAGWNGEIALDIQWAHAIAPGAKILVVATNGQDAEDFQASMQYIVDHRLGSSVSDSWELDTDLIAGPAEQESFDDILTEAAAKGISFNFSTGDGGDAGVGASLGAPGVPSVAPHATSIGGTAILNSPGTNKILTTGWGDQENFLYSDGPVDPPNSEVYFIYGGGGGESVFWPKPAWQKSLPGYTRLTPDISALADPFTGVPVVIYDPDSKAEVVSIGNGGTSLACPIFSAIWAIAQQKAGHALGQAAPTIASLTSGVTDVLPLSSPDNVSGSITTQSGTTRYSANALFAPTNPTKQPFISALFPQPEYNDTLALAFGLDTSLTIGKGWDNETGYGTPNGLPFINAAAAYK